MGNNLSGQNSWRSRGRFSYQKISIFQPAKGGSGNIIVNRKMWINTLSAENKLIKKNRIETFVMIINVLRIKYYKTNSYKVTNKNTTITQQLKKISTVFERKREKKTNKTRTFKEISYITRGKKWGQIIYWLFFSFLCKREGINHLAEKKCFIKKIWYTQIYFSPA